MNGALKYHGQIFELLGKIPEISEENIAAIAERESDCGVSFPESVKEWFSIKGAQELFYENSDMHELEGLDDLGNPDETEQGYLRIAVENQGVVAWYVRLNEGDDPPVYNNGDDWDEDLSTIDWNFESVTFTNFIFDMLSSHCFHDTYQNFLWHGSYREPNSDDLMLLRKHFKEGPRTDTPVAQVYRFFTAHGLVAIVTRHFSDGIETSWTIQSDSAEHLMEIGEQLEQIDGLLSIFKPHPTSKASQVLAALRR